MTQEETPTGVVNVLCLHGHRGTPTTLHTVRPQGFGSGQGVQDYLQKGPGEWWGRVTDCPSVRGFSGTWYESSRVTVSSTYYGSPYEVHSVDPHHPTPSRPLTRHDPHDLPTHHTPWWCVLTPFLVDP